MSRLCPACITDHSSVAIYTDNEHNVIEINSMTKEIALVQALGLSIPQILEHLTIRCMYCTHFDNACVLFKLCDACKLHVQVTNQRM